MISFKIKLLILIETVCISTQSLLNSSNSTQLVNGEPNSSFTI